MGVNAIRWGREQQAGKASRKAVLMALCDYQQGHALEVYVSVATLVAWTELDRKTVMASLKSLQESGLIIDTGLRKGRTRQIPVFRLALVDSQTREDDAAEVPSFAIEPSQQRNGSESGTVPFARRNGSDFSIEGSHSFRETVPKTGHGKVFNDIEQDWNNSASDARPRSAQKKRGGATKSRHADETVRAKAKEIGVAPAYPGESTEAWKARSNARIDNVREPSKQYAPQVSTPSALLVGAGRRQPSSMSRAAVAYMRDALAATLVRQCASTVEHSAESDLPP